MTRANLRMRGLQRRLRREAVVIALAVVGVAGCGHEERADPGAEAGITRTATKGPVEVTLTAAPATVEFERHVRLKIEVVADKSVTVLDSEYEKALGEGDRRFEYRIVRSEKALAQPTSDGRLRWAYLFELEFSLPGDYELPPARISFVDLSATDGTSAEESKTTAPADVQTVTTEPLAITVRPPEGGAMSEAQLHDIPRLDPVELPAAWPRLWWLVPVIAVIMVIVAGFMVRRRRRSRPEVVAGIPAHEWAMRQIAALVAEDLIAGGRVQEFYYRISGIVRGYVERRFGVSAPEMTTEEFLASAAGDSRFDPDTTDELNRFLSACDLVKYARFQPGSEAPTTALRAAREFVERTREIAVTEQAA